MLERLPPMKIPAVVNGSGLAAVSHADATHP
jgi:hypothetical protein